MNDRCPCCKLSNYDVISRQGYEQREQYTVRLLCKCLECQTKFLLLRYYRLEKEEVSES